MFIQQNEDRRRYRVGPNYLQLPINAPQEKAQARTNQRDGQMAYYVDAAGENKHVNYEPSIMGGLKEAPKPAKDYHQSVEGHLGRYETTRTTDDYKQAGERYRTFAEWEREDLVANMVADLKQCPKEIALRMVWHWWHCDKDMAGVSPKEPASTLSKPNRCRPCRQSRHRASGGRQAIIRAVSPKLVSRARRLRQKARVITSSLVAPAQ